MPIVYVDEKGEKQQPIMLHRVIYGSVERFIGILIEHYAGAFPLWLAPIQVSLIPVEPKHAEFTHKLAEQLEANHIFTKVDDRNEKLGYRIREAQIKKIPLEIVIGDKEVNDGTVYFIGVMVRKNERRFRLNSLLRMLRKRLRKKD